MNGLALSAEEVEIVADTLTNAGRDSYRRFFEKLRDQERTTETTRLRRLSLMQLRLGLAYRAAVLENTRLAAEAAA